MLWKLNAAFPSVIWQIFDWYLEPSAGYYFMQRAGEPVHVQLNYDDSAVVVVNRSYQEKSALTCRMEIFTADGKSIFNQSEGINSAPVSVTAVNETHIRNILEINLSAIYDVIK